MVLLAICYGKAPKHMPYTIKWARTGVIRVGIMTVPYILYASIYGFPAWSPNQSFVLTDIVLSAGAGIFIGVLGAAVCEFLNARRMP